MRRFRSESWRIAKLRGLQPYSELADHIDAGRGGYTAVADGAGRLLDQLDRLGVAALDGRGTDAVAEGLLGPRGSVFGRLHFHHLRQELVLRGGVVDGNQLDASDELFLAEKDLPHIGGTDRGAGVGDN